MPRFAAFPGMPLMVVVSGPGLRLLAACPDRVVHVVGLQSLYSHTRFSQKEAFRGSLA